MRVDPAQTSTLLNVDINAMAELVDLLLLCYDKAGQSREVPECLERLRSNIQGARWQRKITYFQAMHAAFGAGNLDQARRELKRLVH